jgi:sulfonate transport system substrate-binding protein
MNRRAFLSEVLGATAIGTCFAVVGYPAVSAQTPTLKEFRIGYQKNGVLVIARQQAALEKRFAKSGVDIKWVEFSSGPPMMEAMNAGSIDFGQVGDSPPIFAQAAGANIVYAAGQPITNGQGVLVKKESDIRALADLKGKRIALGKGTSAHNVIIMALENAGLQFGDITPVYLSPPEGAAAFARGSVDAWAVWDPYFTIGELKGGGRVLAQAIELGKTNSFYIANGDFAARNATFLRDAIAVLADVANWAEANRDLVAKSLADVTGIELAIQAYAAKRSAFAIGRVDDGIIVTQQAVADRFFKLGLIPKRVAIRDAVWSPPQS